MSAPTHTPPHPSRAVGAGARLPWWALVLPTLAFVALLALVLNQADAHAATGDPVLARLLEHLRELAARH
ncbi:hypothetical protein ACL02U_03510 [Streptomyces sp. MS06]|uniref:hypothetical protein n=1 Tax=Streptomyces sp. MS06 TaxID=3385974 RepID=UPI0039A378DB